MGFWFLYIGLLMQFVGVFILTCVEYLNFEWILDRIRRNSFEMVRDEEENKFKRRRIFLLIGFSLVIGGIGSEILNAVSDNSPTLFHPDTTVIHAYNVISQEHLGMNDTTLVNHLTNTSTTMIPKR